MCNISERNDPLDKVSCPACRGMGLKNCIAISIRTGKKIDVTAETYTCLPENESIAKIKGRYYYKSNAEECSLCGGSGEVKPNSKVI